eukprot:CAMPEP_0176461306 /NCGR_PEP_ID=MMETSP0127-20121128/34565_1 /TAXON_ID=938130 /ORGANISM="Platyophrya macrostoma, Strain WH" /LENGTH=70 /DNA_ID=CAMNT_0017852951 /DNA_START=712 /DNA_END=920 /DNA_ORIENTATION=-
MPPEAAIALLPVAAEMGPDVELRWVDEYVADETGTEASSASPAASALSIGPAELHVASSVLGTITRMEVA